MAGVGSSLYHDFQIPIRCSCAQQGAFIHNNDTSAIAAAVDTAKGSDIVIAIVGGDWQTDHEAKDRLDISMYGAQVCFFTFLQLRYYSM